MHVSSTLQFTPSHGPFSTQNALQTWPVRQGRSHGLIVVHAPPKQNSPAAQVFPTQGSGAKQPATHWPFTQVSFVPQVTPSHGLFSGTHCCEQTSPEGHAGPASPCWTQTLVKQRSWKQVSSALQGAPPGSAQPRNASANCSGASLTPPSPGPPSPFPPMLPAPQPTPSPKASPMTRILRMAPPESRHSRRAHTPLPVIEQG